MWQQSRLLFARGKNAVCAVCRNISRAENSGDDADADDGAGNLSAMCWGVSPSVNASMTSESHKLSQRPSVATTRMSPLRHARIIELLSLNVYTVSWEYSINNRGCPHCDAQGSASVPQHTEQGGHACKGTD